MGCVAVTNLRIWLRLWFRLRRYKKIMADSDILTGFQISWDILLYVVVTIIVVDRGLAERFSLWIPLHSELRRPYIVDGVGGSWPPAVHPL